MRRGLLLLALAPLMTLLAAEVGLTGEMKSTPRDTSSTQRLFNPPRVITPEDTTGSGAEPQHRFGRRQGRQETAGCSGCFGDRGLKFGAGGGPVPGYLFADLGDINPKIRKMGIPELSESFFLMGGKGYIRVGNFVIGGGGYGGSTETSGKPDESARYAELELAYGGVIIGVNMTAARFEGIVGMLFGGGSVKIERRRNSSGPVGWDDAWSLFDKNDPDEIPSEDLNISSILRGEFIALEPFVTVKYWAFPFMAIEVSASYLRAKIGGGQWELDGIEIPDSPATNIGGPSVKLGLHFGV
jgi:hypothetical protein